MLRAGHGRLRLLGTRVFWRVFPILSNIVGISFVLPAIHIFFCCLFALTVAVDMDLILMLTRDGKKAFCIAALKVQDRIFIAASVLWTVH